MKLFAKGAIAALLVAAASPAAAESFNGTVTIVRPLTIEQTKALNFGTLVTGTGTFAVSPAGVVSGTATVVPAGGTATEGAYKVKGEAGYGVNLTLSPSFNMTGSGTPIAVTTSPSWTGTQTLSGTAFAEGTVDVAVGGSFTLSNQTSGVYTGSFTLTAVYN